MSKAHIQKLKEDFQAAVHAYAQAFCNKHGYQYDRRDWVGTDGVGEILNVSDLWVNFNDIRTDIDTDAPADQFTKWYWYALRLNELGCTHYINYNSWLKGAPLPYSEEELDNIEAMQRKVEAMKEELKAMCGKEGCKY